MENSLKWKQKKIENRNRKTEIEKQKQKNRNRKTEIKNRNIEKQKANPVELSSYQAIRLDQVKMKQLAYNRDMKVGKNSVKEKYKEQTQND